MINLHEKVKKALRIVSLFATIAARQIGGHGPIAQLVEQWIEDPRVDGSNPSRATFFKRKRWFHVQLPFGLIGQNAHEQRGAAKFGIPD